MKIKKFYAQGRDLCSSEIYFAIAEAAGQGIKKLEFDEEEYSYLIRALGSQITQDTDVASGEFIFWGITMKKIK